MEFSLKETFFVTAVLTLTPLVLVHNNFFNRTFVYEGRVTDAVDGYPVDLVRISSDSDFTFTDRNGQFILKKGSSATNINFEPTINYETPNTPLSCKPEKTSFLVKKYVCEDIVYPQPFDLVIRVLGGLIGQEKQTSEASRTGKEKLWNYLSSYSQVEWKTQSYFVDLMLPYEETSRRLKVLPVSFTVEKKVQKIDRYLYGDREITDNVVQVEATLFFTSNRSHEVNLYFIKEGKFWKYLLPETPNKVIEFNAKNIWVFKKK